MTIVQYTPLVFSVFGVPALIFLYKFIRPKFSIRVSCWFCGKETVVPYGNRNCWDCPTCEQYNGFTQNGDYNKPIPAQYSENLNHPIRCKEDEFLSSQNALCHHCSYKMHLKVRQLAEFEPMNESNFDREAELYERRLENLYTLCDQCQDSVNCQLRKQDDILRQKLGEPVQLPADSADKRAKIHVSPFITKDWNVQRMLGTCACMCAGVIGGIQLQVSQDDLYHVTAVVPSVQMYMSCLSYLGFSAIVGLLSAFLLKLYPVTEVSCPEMAFIPNKTTEHFKTSEQPSMAPKENSKPLEKCDENVQGVMTAFSDFSFGSSGIRRNGSGIFSSERFTSSANDSPPMSVTDALQRQRRPLISPAKLSNIGQKPHTPCSSERSFTWKEEDTPNFEFSNGNTSRPGTPNSLLSQTGFGTPSWTNLSPLKTGSFNQSPRYKTGSFNELPRYSVGKAASWSCSSEKGRYTPSSHRDSFSRNLRRHPINDIDNLKDDDSWESTFCPVDSTTVESKLNISAWKTPLLTGIIAFLLGGSLVANIFLYQLAMDKT